MTVQTITPIQDFPNGYAWRISVERYHAMIETGILTPNDQVELIDGLLIKKMSKKPPHTLANQLASDLIAEHLPTGYFINTQEPVTLADSEPEPDLSVIVGRRRQYRNHHPTADAIELIVEVSLSTLSYDRTIKQRIYAAEGLPIYWIINLKENLLEVYSQPTGPADEPRYRQVNLFSADDNVPLVINEATVAMLPVWELLP